MQHPFDALMELDSGLIRLDCAALHLARDAYPGLDLLRYTGMLDDIADEVARLRPGLDATARFMALRTVIAERRGIVGNQKDYYDPQNSYLNRLLERGLGIPISLAVVWIEVGRRLKWPVSGVNFPGHFLVRVDDPNEFVLVDPFRDGRTLSVEDCQKILDHAFTEKVRFDEEYLKPADTRTILARMLNNLRAIHIAHQDWERLAQVLQRMTAVEPNEHRHRQELAALHMQRGNMRAAYAQLAIFQEQNPKAGDDELVRRNLVRLEAALATLN